MSTETSLKAKSGSFQSLGLDKALLNGLNRIGYKVFSSKPIVIIFN